MNNTAYMESSASPDQLDELMTAMRSVKRHPQGYSGLHLNFSLLDREHKQPYHRRIIATAFNKLIKSHDGQIFWTRHFDLIFICKDCSNAQLDIAILAARRAVEDSPVVKEYIDAGRDDALCDWYDLNKDMDQFMKMVENLKITSETEQPKVSNLKSMVDKLKDNISNDPIPQKPFLSSPSSSPKESATVSSYIPKSQRDNNTPMGPMQLDQLERNLVNMDIFRMMANQTAYVIVGDSNPQPIFVEHFIAVAEIKKSLLPNYNMHADKWLFQRLTRSFDNKLMQILPEKNMVQGQVVSININVETIFTPEFDKFITKFKRLHHQPLILEMALFDVISDIQKYFDARDKLTNLGCRICLDAMDVQSLAVLDREILAVDFLKISWKPNYKNLIGGPMEKKIIAAIEAQGKMRIILCHCDTKEALDFGKSVGIHMYQGFLIDKKYNQ
ncbi:MAG: hypothetical protein K9G26_01615 [Emcibacter sp.]|nr:hypothetical protein [Emcibacter sp.]